MALSFLKKIPPMKIFLIAAIGLLLPSLGHAEKLIPSSLDPALSDVREKVFIPWSHPEQSADYWKKLASKNVPIYRERKHGNLSRALYIPNPGIAYWVLSGLSKEDLFKTHEEKLKIADTLISASVYTDEKGKDVYWALWAPRERAYLLTDKMKELGIGQARIEYSLWEKFEFWVVSLKPFSGFITWASLTVNLILLCALIALLILRPKRRA